MRFEVFNLELNEGLDQSYLTGLDADPFDHWCDHLLVEEIVTGRIVGTYRLQTGPLAAANGGYYGEREFDFSPFESARCEIVELGRACVHREHRQLGVLHLLWRGIARYAIERGARYLIGCSSLTSQDGADGAALYRRLEPAFLAPSRWRTVPQPAYAIFSFPAPEIDVEPKPPKLLRAYLSLGARLCGPPAMDREFKTIDFLTMLDLATLSPAARLHFLGETGSVVASATA